MHITKKPNAIASIYIYNYNFIYPSVIMSAYLLFFEINYLFIFCLSAAFYSMSINKILENIDFKQNWIHFFS